MYPDNTNLHQVSVNGEQVKQLTQNGGNYAVETSAGELIYSKGGGKGLWRLPLIAPTQERKLLANIKLPSSTGWQYTDKGIYYFNVKGNDYRLSFYNFETQAHKDIIRVPERSFRPHPRNDLCARRITGCYLQVMNLLKLTLNALLQNNFSKLSTIISYYGVYSSILINM